MPWTSKYAAGFTKPLVRQVCGILKRDLRAALDWAGGIVYPAAGALPEFITWSIAKAALRQFPSVLIAAHDVEFDLDAEETIHSAPARLAIAMAIAHQQRDVLAERVQDYLRAVDAVLRTSFELTPGDFYLNTLAVPAPPFPAGAKTPGLAAGSLKNLQIASHSLTEVLAAPTEGFVMGGSLVVIAEMEEG